MPKTIKEIHSDYTGNTTIEYSDGSTRTYSADDIATVITNQITGEVEIFSAGVPVIVISDSPPTNTDGRPNGTVYIQRG